MNGRFYFEKLQPYQVWSCSVCSKLLQEKLPGGGQMDRIFMILKNKMTPGVHLSLPSGNILVFDH